MAPRGPLQSSASSSRAFWRRSDALAHGEDITIEPVWLSQHVGVPREDRVRVDSSTSSDNPESPRDGSESLPGGTQIMTILIFPILQRAV